MEVLVDWVETMLMKLETQPTWKLWEWQLEEGAPNNAVLHFDSAEEFRSEL